MNKAIYAIVGLLVASITVTNTGTPVYAQEPVFGSVVDLSKDTRGVRPEIVVTGSNVYVLWSLDKGIFFTASKDNGATFSDPIKLGVDRQYFDSIGSMAVSENIVHIIGTQSDSSIHNIVYMYSNDSGTTFSSPSNLGKGVAPKITTYGKNVYAMWLDSFGVSDIFFRRSSDNGHTFDDAVNLSNSNAHSYWPEIAASDGVYVVWNEDTDNNGVPDEILFRASHYRSDPFGDIMNLSNDSTISAGPQIATFGINVHVLWYDYSKNEDGSVASNVMFRTSSDNGFNFGNAMYITRNNTNLRNVSMEVSGNHVYVVWVEELSLYFSASHNNGHSFSPPFNLGKTTETDEEMVRTEPELATLSDKVFVAWSDPNGVFLRASYDNGNTFDEVVKLDDEVSVSIGEVNLATSENNLYAVWNDYDFLDQKWLILFRVAPIAVPEIRSPIIISKVEPWGPSYFVEGVDICGWGKTSISDALQWVEILNTTNEEVTTLPNWSITFTNGTSFSFAPGLTLAPKESCLIQTGDGISAPIGPEGTGGIGPPSGYVGSAVILKYFVDIGIVSIIYEDSTPVLSDTYGDTRNWQLIDGEWVFKNGKLPDADRTTLTETTEDGSVIVNLILAEEITAPTNSKFRVSFIDALSQQLMNNVNYQMIFEGTSMPVNVSSVPLALVSKDNPFKREWSIDGFAENGTDTQLYTIDSPGSLNITIRILGINNEPLAKALDVKFRTLATTGSPEPLQITEVELDSFEGVQWIELHNPTNRLIKTSKVVVKQLAGEWATALSETPLEMGFGKHNFTINSVMLLPDEYRVFEISSEDDSSEERFLIGGSVLSLVINEREVSRTPELTDNDADSRTWQLEGKQWVFAEATPSRAIPEFPASLMVIAVIGLIGVLIATRCRGNILPR